MSQANADRNGQKLLCFGFVRRWLHLMNIHIQADDIANIIFNYTFTFNFGFIYNPNYCNVFFSDHEAKSDCATNTTNCNPSAIRSRNVTCNFNVKPENCTKSSGHRSSTVIFKPFLSTLLNINYNNNNNNSNNSNINGSNSKFGKSSRLTVIVRKRECKKSIMLSSDDYEFECGLIAIPKEIILNGDHDHDSGEFSDDFKYNSHYDTCKKSFLKQFEAFFSSKALLFSNHSWNLSQLRFKLAQLLQNLKELENGSNVAMDQQCTCTCPYDDYMVSVMSNMSIIYMRFTKYASLVNCGFVEPPIVRNVHDHLNDKNDKNDDNETNCHHEDNINSDKTEDVVYDISESSGPGCVVVLAYGSSDDIFILRRHDFFQLRVDIVDGEYTIDFTKGTTTKRQDDDHFNKSKSVFDAAIRAGQNKIGEEMDKLKCRKLNFDKYDYLFAIDSYRCICDNVDGFELQVFVEQFDQSS